MKVVKELPYIANSAGYGRYHEAWGNSGFIQARGLVYTSGEDVRFPGLNMTQNRYGLGLLGVITGNNTIAKSIEIEITPDEMADFCRLYLKEYEG